MRNLLLIFIGLTITLNSFSDIVFLMRTNQGNFVGKNLDCKYGDGFILENQKGIIKTAFIKGDYKPAKWTSLFGSMTFNQIGKDFPEGGINTQGLLIETIKLKSTKYPEPTGRSSVNEFQIVQYLLDMCENTKEAISLLKETDIVETNTQKQYFIADKSGDVAIIEFLNGKIKIYTGDDVKAPVLIEKEYEKSIKYRNEFRGYGGNRLLKRYENRQDFYVHACIKIDKPLEPYTKHADMILEKAKTSSTQWQILYDIDKQKIKYVSRDKIDPKFFNLGGFKFNCNREVAKGISINNGGSGSIVRDFKEFDVKTNKTCVKDAVKNISFMESYSKDFIKELYEYIESFECKKTK